MTSSRDKIREALICWLKGNLILVYVVIPKFAQGKWVELPDRETWHLSQESDPITPRMAHPILP